MTVRQLCNIVQQTVDTLFPDEIWVRGAISGLKRSSNGHVYFDLVDPDEPSPTAVLPIALFANNKHRVNAILKRSGGSVKMTDGVEIQIRGRLTYYPRQSRMQLLMSLIDPAFTLGQITAQRDRVLAALHAEGLLESNRQLETPALPLRVCLITSAGSAAEADFLHEIAASRHPFEIVTIDTRVQGEEAVASIVGALAQARDLAVDAIALVRGGGARTDLAAFDHESVARAIAASGLPVIVGIGHETDRSVADEVAHAAAKTPTACARYFIDLADRFGARVDLAAAGIARATDRLLGSTSAELTDHRSRLARAANRTLEREGTRIAVLGDGIERATQRTLERNDTQLDAWATRLSDLDPATTMARGWSITRTADGSTLRSVEDISVGATLITALADGELVSTVDRSAPSTSTVGAVPPPMSGSDQNPPGAP